MRALFIKALRGQVAVEALVRLRSLLVLPIATRLLGTTGYGQIAVAAAITGLVGTVATLGMPSALARFLPGKETDDERARLFWPAFASCAVTVVACAGLTIAVFAAVPSAHHDLPLALVVVAALNVVSNELKLFLYSFWRVNVEFDQYYRFLIADTVAVAAAQLAVLLLLHKGAIAVVASLVVVDAVVLGVAVLLLSRRLPWHRPSLSLVGPLYRYGLPLGFTALLIWANNAADRFFVQAYRGTDAVGLYSVGYNLGVIGVAIVGTPMVSIVSSLMFRAWDRGEREEAERLPRNCATLLVLACLPLILSLAYFGRPLVELLAGSAFAGAHDYVALVGVGYLLLHLGVLFGYPLWLHNRQYLYSLSMVASVVVNIGLNAALVPPYGAYGSAVATTASLGVLAAGLVVWNLRGGYSRPPIALPVAMAAIAVACWTLAGLVWPSEPTIVDTIAFSGVTTAAFAAALVALRLVPSELRPGFLRRRLAAS